MLPLLADRAPLKLLLCWWFLNDFSFETVLSQTKETETNYQCQVRPHSEDWAPVFRGAWDMAYVILELPRETARLRGAGTKGQGYNEEILKAGGAQGLSGDGEQKQSF